MNKKYEVNFYTGDYAARQKAANQDRASVYIEQHFNSVTNQAANYAHAKVATNAGSQSKAIAKTYAHLCAEAFGCPIGFEDGVDAGGRGNANLKWTNMPAILLEPLFVSNPAQAAIVKSKEGQEKLARILADTIKKHYPGGALVAFSIGHKGKTSQPRDMGAPVHGGGTEAEYAEIVMRRAAELLEQS